MMEDSCLNLPSGFSQIPIFHSVDRLLLDLSLLKFQGHFCICKAAVISGKNRNNPPVQPGRGEKKMKETEYRSHTEDLRLSLLPIKGINFRLHQHVGKNQISDTLNRNNVRM